MENEKMELIGYCPTMEKFVNDFIKNKQYEIINLVNAKQVLFSLNNNKIDIGIIGRVAKKSEFDGFKKRFGFGYTLVTNSKQMILNKKLRNLTIHMLKLKTIDRSMLPKFKQIIYHEIIPNKINNQDIWLIDWDDWNDNFELLIPTDMNNNKNPSYRIPHLYSKKIISN